MLRSCTLILVICTFMVGSYSASTGPTSSWPVNYGPAHGPSFGPTFGNGGQIGSFGQGYSNGPMPSIIHFNQPIVAFAATPIRSSHPNLHVSGPATSPTRGQRVLSRPPVPTPKEESASSQVQCTRMSPIAERQLLSYVAGVEALTGSIQELDEAVQELKPVTREACQPAPMSSTVSSIIPSSQVSAVTEPTATLSTVTEIRSDLTELVGTTESFTDAPVPEESSAIRRRRETTEGPFGMPATTVPSTEPKDQVSEDLAKASNDLKELRKDLNSTAEFLRQTNNTVHSVMLKALQAYVTSIERRVDHQRQMYAQTKGIGLKAKISAIKDKVSTLIDKLKIMSPFHKPGSPINYNDRFSTPVVASAPMATIVTNNSPTTTIIPGVAVPTMAPPVTV